MSVRAYACCRSAWPGIGCRRSLFPYWRCSRQAVSTSRVCTLWRVLTPGRVRHWLLAIRANACRACRHCWTIIGRIRGSLPTAIAAHEPSRLSSTFNPPTTWRGTESWRPRPPTPSMNSPAAEYFQLYGRVRGFEAGPAGETVCRDLPDSRGNHVSLASCRACLRQQPALNSLCPARVVRRACRGRLRRHGNPAGVGAGLGSQIPLHHLDRADRHAAGPPHRGVSHHVRPPGLGDPPSQETQPQMRSGYGS